MFTEKVDGTNIRVIFTNYETGRENSINLIEPKIIFKGKTDNAQIPSFLIAKLQEIFLPQLNKFKKKFITKEEPFSVCLYGEGYGSKIQKGGGNYRKDQSFVLFDVNINGWWLQRKDVEEIASFFGLDIVPIIGEGTLEEMIVLTKGGFNSFWGDFLAEGIVARPKVELKARNGHRIITKIKYKDFIKNNNEK